MKAKICILGEFAVGKSSLTRRLVQNEFDAEYKSTIGVSIHRHVMQVRDEEYSLIVWDLEGGEESLDTIQPYLRGATGAVVVADLSRPETISKLSVYQDYLNTHANLSSLVVALNKSDLVEAPEDQVEKVRSSFLSKIQGPAKTAVRVTSAATGSNVDELFSVLCENLV
ncbi:MAG: Rab family GTPase [Alphaproteobacteria bacterium]